MTVVKSDEHPGRDEGDRRLTVADLIHRRLDRLTPAERKAARALLASYPMIGLESLANFADHAQVSHPSVLRFIAKLGFNGYSAFQSSLRTELEARLKSPLAKHRREETDAGGTHDFLQRFAEAACDNIRQSVASLPRSEFDGALDLLANESSPVYLLGGRFTDAVAHYLYMHLRVLRSGVHHVSGPPVSWSEYLLDMDRRSVLVVFDVRRYQGDVVRFAEEAAKRGTRVLLITDQWLSPIAGNAEHVLAAHIDVPSNWDSVAAITALVEALIAALNNREWPRLKARIRDLETLRSYYEDMWPKSESEGD